MEIDLPKLPKGERRAESFLKTRPDLNSKLVLASDMSLHKSSDSSKKLCDLNTTTLMPDDTITFSPKSDGTFRLCRSKREKRGKRSAISVEGIVNGVNFADL